jgi:predicted phage tail protein
MKDPNKYRGFYVDWWNIKKSTIYGVIAVVLTLGILIGGGWWLYRNDFFLAKTEVDDTPKDAAKIISYEGDVRITRAATRETIIVNKTTYVSAGDTVQTQADGRAQIQMIDGSILTIRPNSTVIIRDSSSIFGGKNVRVALDSGQMNVKTEDQPGDTENIVEVKESENKLLPQTDASFGINPNTSGGEIRVSRGGVETNIGGEKTVVQNGEFASVNNGKTSKENLLEPPRLVAPNAQTPVQALASGAADVTFSWEKPAAAIQSYHLQVSKSPFFVSDTIIFERTSLAQTTFTVANIAPGTYYWQVRAVAGSGQTSEWSEKVRFAIFKGQASQPIAINEWQVEKLGGRIYIVKGKTQAGVIVRAAGRETRASADGAFQIQISSTTPEVVVEASDERGNRSSFVISLATARVLRQY